MRPAVAASEGPDRTVSSLPCSERCRTTWRRARPCYLCLCRGRFRGSRARDRRSLEMAGVLGGAAAAAEADGEAGTGASGARLRRGLGGAEIKKQAAGERGGGAEAGEER